MKYTKKPVTIEAFKFDYPIPGSLIEETLDSWPAWLQQAWAKKEFDYNQVSKLFCIDTLEGVMNVSNGDYIIQGVHGELYPCKADIFHETYVEGEAAVAEKDLSITEVKGAKDNIDDLEVYGDGDTFKLLCKASSQSQGWMKSTKVCNVPGGCVMQVTTQQRNPDGSYAVAEALTYVPSVGIDCSEEPRRIIRTQTIR